jgi:galactose oxidase
MPPSRSREKRPPVVVGVTPTCPYGISACWGGVYEALTHLRGVRLVRPVPNAGDSTAYVYLEHEGLPDLDVWPSQFANIANGTHIFRGAEVTAEGLLQIREGSTLVMHGDDIRGRLYSCSRCRPPTRFSGMLPGVPRNHWIRLRRTLI